MSSSLGCAARGIDTLTAFALVAEIGDFSRFKTAAELMAFVGLVPPSTPPASSAAKAPSPRSATRTSGGCSSKQPGTPAAGRPSAAALRRHRGQDPAVIERAWRCQQRLHQRWQRMAGRGKPHQKIVVACARELAGFVWAIATDQALRSA